MWRAQHEEQRFSDRYGDELRVRVENELAARIGRRRTLNLTAGRVGLRTCPSAFVATDTAALVRWCHENLLLLGKCGSDAGGNELR
jgi:hypothetical protein